MNSDGFTWTCCLCQKDPIICAFYPVITPPLPGWIIIRHHTEKWKASVCTHTHTHSYCLCVQLLVELPGRVLSKLEYESRNEGRRTLKPPELLGQCLKWYVRAHRAHELSFGFFFLPLLSQTRWYACWSNVSLRAGCRIWSEYPAARGRNPLIVSDQNCEAISYSPRDWHVSYHGDERLRTKCCHHHAWCYSWSAAEWASWTRIAEEPPLWGYWVLNNLFPPSDLCLFAVGYCIKWWARWFVLRSKDTHFIEYLLYARPCFECFIGKASDIFPWNPI